MDALPLVVNQHQLKLMQEAVKQVDDTLNNQHQAGKFDSSENQEQILSTYGTNEYKEAHTLVQDIDQQLNSLLKDWHDAPEADKPVSIALNSYQVELLRTGLNQSNHSSTEQPDTQKLLADLLEQLPESVPQEQSD